MIALSFCSNLAHHTRQYWEYRLGRHTVVSDCPLVKLSHLAKPVPPSADEYILDNVDIEAEASMSILYSSRSWIGGSWRHVEVSATNSSYRINVEDVGNFAVDKGGRNVRLLERSPEVCDKLLQEAALGPPILLAFAVHDDWAMHASGIEIGGKAFGFLGESGSGKSTLAEYLCRTRSNDMQRISDDILPFGFENAQAYAFPHFPQLKLTPSEQPQAYLPEKLPLAGIFELVEPHADNDAATISPLSQRDGLIVVARNTVASRLFDQQLLSRHLASCTKIAEVTPAYRLEYPRTFDALSQVRDAILGCIQDLD